MSIFFVIFFFNFVFSENELYGMQYSLSTQLMKINPETLDYTNVGSPLEEVSVQQLASLDSKNEVFYSITYNNEENQVYLTGLDINTGKKKYHLELPIYDSEILGVGQNIEVDSTNGDVLVVGRELDNLHHILRVTPSTGSIKDLGKFGYLDVLGGASAFMSGAQLLVLNYAVNETGDVKFYMYMYDVSGSAKLVRKVLDTFWLETMSYDVKTGLIYGVGLKVPPGERTLLSMDSKGGVKEISTIDEYFIIDSDLAAIDPDKRVLYAMIQKRGKTMEDPFDFLTISLETGELVGEPAQCYMSPPGDKLCPISLELKYD